MILHCVFCDFETSVDERQKGSILKELAEFSVSLEGVLGFEFGPNLDFEGKSERYDWGFVVRFADPLAADRYAVSSTHQALGARLCALCKGGADGIMVYDLSV